NASRDTAWPFGGSPRGSDHGSARQIWGDRSLQVHCWTFAPISVEPPATSRQTSVPSWTTRTRSTPARSRPGGPPPHVSPPPAPPPPPRRAGQAPLLDVGARLSGVARRPDAQPA